MASLTAGYRYWLAKQHRKGLRPLKTARFRSGLTLFFVHLLSEPDMGMVATQRPSRKTVARCATPKSSSKRCVTGNTETPPAPSFRI
jgi:hypothetical protein